MYIRTVSRLICLTKLIISFNHKVSILYDSMNHIKLPLFVLNKVNIALIRPFLCLYCLTMLLISLNQEVSFISLFFMFLYSMNHIKLGVCTKCPTHFQTSL